MYTETWEAETGNPVTMPLEHEARVVSARFGPGGTLLLTASNDQTARVWGCPEGTPAMPPLRHSGHVLSASFSTDARYVITASADQAARLWDTSTALPPCRVLRHDAAVHHVSFSPDGLSVATASDDHEVQSEGMGCSHGRAGHALHDSAPLAPRARHRQAARGVHPGRESLGDGGW